MLEVAAQQMLLERSKREFRCVSAPPAALAVAPRSTVSLGASRASGERLLRYVLTDCVHVDCRRTCATRRTSTPRPTCHHTHDRPDRRPWTAEQSEHATVRCRETERLDGLDVSGEGDARQIRIPIPIYGYKLINI